MKTGTQQASRDHPAFTDTTLIERAVVGDRDARDTLAVACLSRVIKVVYLTYGPKKDMNEVVQIAMVTAFRDLSKLRNSGGFKAWLDKVVYNTVRSHGRRRTRFLSLFSLSKSASVEQETSATPENETAGELLFTRLQIYLEMISEKKRTAAAMSLLFGYVDTEIADLMRCSVKAAKRHAQDGRQELFVRLQKDPEYRYLLERLTQ